MKFDELDKICRAGEVYRDTRVPPDCYIILRVDGRCFTPLTKKHYKKPFDEKFSGIMRMVASKLLSDYNGLLAETHSDEISLLLPREWDMFSREVEKIVTVASGVASSMFTHLSGHPGAFDGRVVVYGSDQAVIDYFRWRQSDAYRGAAQPVRDGKLTWDQVEGWQKKGSLLYWYHAETDGYYYKTVTAVRRFLRTNTDPPIHGDYDRFLKQVLSGTKLLELLEVA